MDRLLRSLIVLGLVAKAAGAEPSDDNPPEPEPPTKLKVGKRGRWSPGMLAQAWLDLQRSNGRTTLLTFKLRRAELAVHGEIVPDRWAFRVMMDPARFLEQIDTPIVDSAGNTSVIKQPPGPSAALRDVYITMLTSIGDLSIGQFKIPVSWEGYNSSAKLWFPERAPVSREFGDRRDLGLRFTKTFTYWGYFAGLFNGQGENNLDTNVQKDLGLRLEVYPVEGMTIAGVLYDAIGERNLAGTKDRWEADLRYAHGPYLFQSEYIRARDVYQTDARATQGQGFYTTIGYMLEDPSLHGVLQPVARIGFLDLDIGNRGPPPPGRNFTTEWDYDVGLNYYIEGDEMKLQLWYSFQNYNTRPSINEIVFAAQVWY